MAFVQPGLRQQPRQGGSRAAYSTPETDGSKVSVVAVAARSRGHGRTPSATLTSGKVASRFLASTPETWVPKKKNAAAPIRPSSATDGLEAKLWAAADALRNNMDAAEYKHVVLGLVFLKYISDAFEAKHAELMAQKKQGA